MDDEDLAQRAESQTLETQGGFAGLGSASDGGGQGKGMFADLFRTTGETMGTKLLQRMGWRQGQGVGPKVRRRVKGDEKGETHLFAPENSRMISFRRKTDRKGLGFAGEERLESGSNAQNGDDEESDADARILKANRSDKTISKQKKLKKSGIGIGVLNDTGSDDEDEYDMGPKISYNRIIGGDKKKRKGGLVASNASPAVLKPVFQSKKLTQQTTTSSGFRKCHDGRLPIDGFVLALSALTILQENRYPPPVVPEGWVPAQLSKSGGGETAAFQSTADAAKASTLDPKARAAILGEQQLPGKSVFDFLSSAARERLASATGRTNLPPALGEKAPAGTTSSDNDKARSLWDMVPHLDSKTAAAALERGNKGWMPYSEDDSKRDRYRYFLELQVGLQTRVPDRPKTFSLDDWSRELNEFAQAAEVFKPVSGLMASRFTTSSSAPKLASDGLDATSSATPKLADPAEEAARMGMYGPMTRSRQPFYPTRLLCKRFNVRPPAGVDPGDADGAEKRTDIVSQSNLDRMMREASFRPGSNFVSAGTEGGGDDKPTSRDPQTVVDVERNDALEGQRAGEDVFKAVFGDDDE